MHARDERGKRFPQAIRGYAHAEVDAYLDEVHAKLEELGSEVERVSAENQALHLQVAELQAQLEAMRLRLQEAEELQVELAEMREAHGSRVRAIEMILAAAAREVGMRLQTAGPPDDAEHEGREGDRTPRSQSASPGDAAARERESATTAPTVPESQRSED
jgi:DivIVA domain-containing protein